MSIKIPARLHLISIHYTDGRVVSRWVREDSYAAVEAEPGFLKWNRQVTAG